MKRTKRYRGCEGGCRIDVNIMGPHSFLHENQHDFLKHRYCINFSNKSLIPKKEILYDEYHPDKRLKKNVIKLGIYCDVYQTHIINWYDYMDDNERSNNLEY